jgi:hypothetical protein
MTSAPTSPSKCIGKTKTKTIDNHCKYDGIYVLDGQHFCGIHVPKERKDQAEVIGKSKARSSISASVTLMNVCDELDEAIGRRLATNDFGDASAASSSETPKLDARVIKMTTMPRDQRRIIIRRAIELAGSQDNVVLVIAHVPTAVSDFLRAAGERRLRMVYKPLYISTLKNCQANQAPPSPMLCVEDGNTVRFPDVDITVANCSRQYLEPLGISSISELCEDGDVIYMGPKGALISPIGATEPTEDSEWYIPLPDSCKLRITHNKLKTQEILNAIKNGEDCAERYMALRGKILACICLPYPCHCMVYVDVVRALVATTPRQELAVVELNGMSPVKTPLTSVAEIDIPDESSRTESPTAKQREEDEHSHDSPDPRDPSVQPEHPARVSHGADCFAGASSTVPQEDIEEGDDEAISLPVVPGRSQAAVAA